MDTTYAPHYSAVGAGDGFGGYGGGFGGGGFLWGLLLSNSGLFCGNKANAVDIDCKDIAALTRDVIETKADLKSQIASEARVTDGLIGGVRSEAANNTNAILSAISATEVNRLQDELAQARAGKQQSDMTLQVISANAGGYRGGARADVVNVG